MEPTEPKFIYSPTEGEHIDAVEPIVESTISEAVDALPVYEHTLTNRALARSLGVSHTVTKNLIKEICEDDSELVTRTTDSRGRTSTFVHPELASQIRDMVAARRVDAGPPLPEGAITNNALARELGATRQAIRKIAESLLDDESDMIVQGTQKGKKVQAYAKELADRIRDEFGSVVIAQKGDIQVSTLAREVGAANETIQKIAQQYLEENPEWAVIARAHNGRVSIHYCKQLADLVRNNLHGISAPLPGELPAKTLADELGIAPQTLELIAQAHVGNNPELVVLRRNNRGRIFTYYKPEFSNILREEIASIPPAQENEITVPLLARELAVKPERIRAVIDRLVEEQPKLLVRRRHKVTGRAIDHLTPELTDRVRSVIEPELARRHAEREYKIIQSKLRESATNFLDEVARGETQESQEIQGLINLFGPEKAVDILYRYREGYIKLDVPFVRRIIGEYLGDFLSLRPGLNLEDLEEGVDYLTEPNLKDGLIEVVKNDALRFYNERHRTHPDQSDLDIFALYVDNLRTLTTTFSTAELAEVLDEVAQYYNSLFEIGKPSNMVDQLKDGRLFPDVNQRINIREIEMKHKMLIADEMGVGKSASAIMAKETLGVKQALIVVPSNVIDVWKKYLSDQRAANGEAEGYFKEGCAPKVLIIESLKQLGEVNPDDYDYVILSQERLNSSYIEALQSFDYGMLIVDEVHKLKNIGQGKRAENLIELAARIEEDDEIKYLALLSGTPVPNKVGDVAMILRLLYPEKFEHISNQELTRQILKGDMLDLRSLLVPRMQMKSLAESIEIPNLHEESHIVDMTEDEASVYEILLEEDELTASQKIQILRQFLLNPAISEVTPGIKSAKLEAVRDQLQKTYLNKDKVVMFVNGYVEGVIRGGQTIFDQLDLPEDVELHVIDGRVSKEKRLEIQQLLRDPRRKMLLAVSGQTADVGVDFSGAQEVVFYNEPWTRYDKRQQLGRVWRPGLQDDLVSHTFYVRGTIEEGIHRYTEVKERAIEKLLRGVPLSELEREMLKADEQESSPDLDVNPALAEHYFSAWDRLLKIFNYVKEIGETNFVEFKNRYGEEYARCYTEMGSRSYQSNVNRLAGSVIDRLAKDKKQEPKHVRILDVASGPEMLRRHIPDDYQEGVVSVDINPHHFEQIDDKRRIGSFLDLPVADSTVDYANLALALHYTKFLPSRQNYERLEVFKELNRVLVTGGVAVVSLMHTLEIKHPNTFKKAIEKMGFETVEKYTGTAEAGQGFRTRVIVLKKVHDCPQNTTSLVQTLGSGLLFGFKFAKNKVDLRDSRKIVTKFSIDGRKPIEARLNLIDQQVFDEEQAILALAKELKRRYHDVHQIPREKIEASGFARAYTGRKYVLFKRLESSTGAVIAR